MKAITFAIAKGLEDAYDVMTHSPSPNESRFEDRGRSFLIRSERYEHKMRYSIRITESTPYEVWQAMELRDVDGVSIVYGEDFAPKYLLVTSEGIEVSFDIVQKREKPPAHPCRPSLPHKPKHDKCDKDKYCKPNYPHKHPCVNGAQTFPFPMVPVPTSDEEDEESEYAWAPL